MLEYYTVIKHDEEKHLDTYRCLAHKASYEICSGYSYFYEKYICTYMDIEKAGRT